VTWWAGVDIGSLTTEAVVIDEGGEAGAAKLPTGADSRRAAGAALDEAARSAGIDRDRIGLVVATGYGRISAPFPHKKVTEITCHARGAFEARPGTRTVIDIGGQDSKVIRVGPGGRVVDFVMNEKCAAGTGRFLEVMAAALEVELEGFGPLALRSREPVNISSMCTVFAESEVVSLIASGAAREDIAWGLCRSIAARLKGLAGRVGVEPDITLTGGVAHNEGVVRALEEALGVKVHVPERPQFVGALGAALLARSSGG